VIRQGGTVPRNRANGNRGRRLSIEKANGLVTCFLAELPSE